MKILSTAVLNPTDLEAEKKKIIVTSSEIEEHRHVLWHAF